MERNMTYPDEEPAIESIRSVQKYRKIRVKMTNRRVSNLAMIDQEYCDY